MIRLLLMLCTPCLANEVSRASIDLVFVAKPTVQVDVKGNVRANHTVKVIRTPLGKKTVLVTVITQE